MERIRRRRRERNYALLAVATWTALTAIAFLAERWRSHEAVRDAAELGARLSFDFLRLARAWNARHGGVYVPVAGELQPNPFLSHVPDREARTASGRELTLMNPAWMTRELLELARERLQVAGHITSLEPIRPGNAPDPWERGALERIRQTGATDFSELVERDGAEWLRFMGALRVEASCLKCHAGQGYAIGDLRGGIGVAVPLAPLVRIGARDVRRQALVHGSIWFLGLLAIGVAFADHRRRSLAEEAAEERSREAEAALAAGRRLEAVGRLSSGVAHDFNNLLAPVLTISGVVRDELPEESPLRADLEDIRASALRARDLVRALQTLSRKNGAQLERVALGSVAAEGESLLRSVAGTRMAFALEVIAGVPEVLGDRPLLELAMANLIVNAREGAVQGRTIRLTVAPQVLGEDEAARLHVRTGRHAAVTVFGDGVAPELLQGNAGFVSVQGAAAADPGGAGVGLATIGGIVAQYGGGVVAREAPGAGWVVRLLLPEATGGDQPA